MTEELRAGSKQSGVEQIKTPEQQEKERIELLKLISEKIPTLWEKDYKDVSIAELVTIIDSANTELKKEIVDEILEKYYDDCETARDSNIFIEAPHGKTPSLAEMELMLGQYDEFKGIDSEVIKSTFDKIERELFDVENARDKTLTKIRVSLQNECEKKIEDRRGFIERVSNSTKGNATAREQFIVAAKKDVLENSLKLTMLKIIGGSDIYVSELAMSVAGDKYNYTTPAVSRKLSDANKIPGNRSIGKTKRLESGHGSALAQYYALERAVKSRQGKNEIENNFYHITLLERDSREPFTIGAGAHDGMLPCEMDVMKYISEELESRLKEEGVLKRDGSEYVVEMDENKKFKGAKVNTQCRWGKDKFEGIGLGEKYNTIQLAIPSLALKNYGTKIAKILQDILKELR